MSPETQERPAAASTADRDSPARRQRPLMKSSSASLRILAKG